VSKGSCGLTIIEFQQASQTLPGVNFATGFTDKESTLESPKPALKNDYEMSPQPRLATQAVEILVGKDRLSMSSLAAFSIIPLLSASFRTARLGYS
jgi:hypothetical protein